jgi:hypothetical protein
MPSTNSPEPTIYKKYTDIQVLQEKKVLSFPEYLGNTPADELGNDFAYMIFKINTATSGSKLKDDTAVASAVFVEGTQQSSTTGPLAGIAFGGGGTALDENKQYVDKASLPAGSAAENENWVKKPGMSRLDRVVVLPMPSDYRVGTTINYADTTQDTLGNIGDAVTSVRNGTGASDLMKMGISGLSTTLINALSAMAGAGDVTSFNKMAARSRAALNPKKETLFEDMDFRKFSFQYTLAPRNAHESKIIQEIIQTFRYYSLPELSKSKLFYSFPSEFEIMIMQGSRENPSIPRIATCILKSVDVTYSPGGTWSNFRDGMAVQAHLSLEFQELELIDRNRVWSKTSKITSGY